MDFFIILGILVLVVIYIISKYNSLVALKNNREQAFADIDVQLKLRFDLVPNLVETVKGYASHEKQTLEAVINARNNYSNAKTADEKIAANNSLAAGLSSIFALAESYPDLKANNGFVQLQAELSDIENKIAASRRFFNAATNEFNTYVEMFPSNIIAKIFSFSRLPSFEVADRAAIETAPKVQF